MLKLGGNSRGGNTVIPLFRDCAGCTDGEALQARDQCAWQQRAG